MIIHLSCDNISRILDAPPDKIFFLSTHNNLGVRADELTDGDVVVEYDEVMGLTKWKVKVISR